MAKEILLIPHSHFDPAWRRCFDRPARYNGVCVRSYAELEERIINGWLELAPRGFTFDEGQAAVWRKYLERNPSQLESLRKEADAGRLNLVLAGETVQDSVMSTAEGLVRNFLTAMPLYHEIAGEDHPGLRIAWLEDAFGNSPNYPQVLRGVGAAAVAQISYQQLPEDVWVGIDGTKIPCLDSFFERGGGPWVYHPPCPECKGEGCDACDGSGMKIRTYLVNRIEPGLQRAIESDKDWIAIICTSEEGIPTAEIADLVDDLNARSDGKYEFRYATFADLHERVRDELDRLVSARDDSPSKDLNPAMPGCMVSRIKIKQRVRAIAYKLVVAEALAANAAWQNGEPVAQDPEVTEAWRNVLFCQFHDNITGTHIDSAYAELMDMLDLAEAVADGCLGDTTTAGDVAASTGQARPEGALEDRSSKGVADPESQLALGPFTISYDREGVLAVLQDGKDPWFNTEKSFIEYRRPMRIGELTIESDFGDAWVKRWPPAVGITGDASLVYLGAYNTSVEAGDDWIRWQGVYDGGDPQIDRLAWTTTLRLAEPGDALAFTTEVDWDTSSRRLRVAFPLSIKDSTATYEVPFGFLDRTFDPEKLVLDEMKSDSQEYGTLHWWRKEIANGTGVAIFNKGIPCHRYHNGIVDLSLLRSPEHEFSANLPIHYEFWDIDGQRDTGQHRFEYAILPYTNGLAPGDLTRRGYDYNRPGPIELPFELEGDVVVTAWKPAEDGDGWILRVQDAGGEGTALALRFNQPREVIETNLLEAPQAESHTGREHTFSIHRHGILTVRVR